MTGLRCQCKAMNYKERKETWNTCFSFFAELRHRCEEEKKLFRSRFTETDLFYVDFQRKAIIAVDESAFQLYNLPCYLAIVDEMQIREWRCLQRLQKDLSHTRTDSSFSINIYWILNIAVRRGRECLRKVNFKRIFSSNAEKFIFRQKENSGK